MHARMLSRVRNHFQGAKFARMSSGTYCVIRDLGLVKGGKGMRHHEVLITFSAKASWSAIRRACGGVVIAGRRRVVGLQRDREAFSANVSSSAVPDSVSRP
jgi:hypothetical protein